MDSIIEVQRQTHEEIEHFERALYTILAKPTPTHETKLQTEHKAAQILDRISARVDTLNNLYEDQETRQSELDLLSAPPNSNDLAEFYKRLGKIQEHYAKYPESLATTFDMEVATLLEDEQGDADNEEYEEDDRKYNLLISPQYVNVQQLHIQPSPCFSPEKSNTGSTWICILITQRTTT